MGGRDGRAARGAGATQQAVRRRAVDPCAAAVESTTSTDAPCRRASGGWRTSAPAGGRARCRTRRSGSPTGCRGCPSGSSTTSCCTSWHTCSSRPTGRAFWALLTRYPELEQARGFLDGWSLALQRAGVDSLRVAQSAGSDCVGHQGAHGVVGVIWQIVGAEPAPRRATPRSAIGSLRGARRPRTARPGGCRAPPPHGAACRSSRTGAASSNVEVDDARLLAGLAQRRVGRLVVDRLDVPTELQPQPHLAMKSQQHAGTSGVDDEGRRGEVIGSAQARCPAVVVRGEAE